MVGRVLLYTTLTGDLVHRGHIQLLQKIRVWGIAISLASQACSPLQNQDGEGLVGELLFSEKNRLKSFVQRCVGDRGYFAKCLDRCQLLAGDKKLVSSFQDDGGDSPLRRFSGWRFLKESVWSSEDNLLLLVKIVKHFQIRGEREQQQQQQPPRSPSLEELVDEDNNNNKHRSPAPGLRLVVGVTGDARASVRKRVPVIPFRDRAEVFRNLWLVDEVHEDVGRSKSDIYHDFLRFDAVFIGNDYKHDPEYRNIFSEAGLEPECVRPPVVFLERFAGTSTTVALQTWQKKYFFGVGGKVNLRVMAQGVAGTVFCVGDSVVLKTVKLGSCEKRCQGSFSDRQMRSVASRFAPVPWKSSSATAPVAPPDAGQPAVPCNEENFPQNYFGDVYGLGHRKGFFPRNWKFLKNAPPGQNSACGEVPCVAGYNGLREVFANLYLSKHEPEIVSARNVVCDDVLPVGAGLLQATPVVPEVPGPPELGPKGKLERACRRANLDRSQNASTVYTLVQENAGPTFERVVLDLHQTYSEIVEKATWLAVTTDATTSAAASLPRGEGEAEYLEVSAEQVFSCYRNLLLAVQQCIGKLQVHGFLHGDLHEGNICVPDWNLPRGSLRTKTSSRVARLRNVAAMAGDPGPRNENLPRVVLLDFGWCSHRSLFFSSPPSPAQEDEADFVVAALKHNFDWLHLVGSLSNSALEEVRFFHEEASAGNRLTKKNSLDIGALKDFAEQYIL